MGKLSEGLFGGELNVDGNGRYVITEGLELGYYGHNGTTEFDKPCGDDVDGLAGGVEDSCARVMEG